MRACRDFRDEHQAETGEPSVGQEPIPLAPEVRRDGLAVVIAALRHHHVAAPSELVHVAPGQQPSGPFHRPPLRLIVHFTMLTRCLPEEKRHRRNVLSP